MYKFPAAVTLIKFGVGGRDPQRVAEPANYRNKMARSRLMVALATLLAMSQAVVAAPQNPVKFRHKGKGHNCHPNDIGAPCNEPSVLTPESTTPPYEYPTEATFECDVSGGSFKAPCDWPPVPSGAPHPTPTTPPPPTSPSTPQYYECVVSGGWGAPCDWPPVPSGAPHPTPTTPPAPTTPSTPQTFVCHAHDIGEPCYDDPVPSTDPPPPTIPPEPTTAPAPTEKHPNACELRGQSCLGGHGRRSMDGCCDENS